MFYLVVVTASEFTRIWTVFLGALVDSWISDEKRLLAMLRLFVNGPETESDLMLIFLMSLSMVMGEIMFCIILPSICCFLLEIELSSFTIIRSSTRTLKGVLLKVD